MEPEIYGPWDLEILGDVVLIQKGHLTSYGETLDVFACFILKELNRRDTRQKIR